MGEPDTNSTHQPSTDRSAETSATALDEHRSPHETTGPQEASDALPLMQELQETLEALASSGAHSFTPSGYPGAGLASLRRDELFARLHQLEGDRVMPWERHSAGGSLAYNPGHYVHPEEGSDPTPGMADAAADALPFPHHSGAHESSTGQAEDPFLQPGLEDPHAYTEFYPWPGRPDPSTEHETQAEREARSELSAQAGARLKGHRHLASQRRVQKLAWLIHLEVERIVDELELRQALLLKVWSKMRIRTPLLRILRCRYEKIRPTDLLLLPLETLELCERFYRKLDAFRLYLQVTEDMPTTLATAWQQYKEALTQLGRPLLAQLKALHHYDGLGEDLGQGTELESHP